ncbi:3-hydroxyacyl-CoA dehydrogenase family protein [Paracraurococcus ruber]|uniref:L-gulonate 3-dehydrogenase n=1 Tax=Paracraurococcus ruber TaxID=77675 RepID=A0ABS1CXP2_9PROT|nr:3-hydroxyacyl-CoA dehydrogenase family protein [Paracraurococcus ruber]MBK1658489.1 3-hydroxyacyl-CoA dehydrogenase [Paracraurococcus ruber]TDG19172.1 3-hydroxyacyl-CoA dehydrogenase family protein [Paracraurococcus ruber]
MARVAVIGAGTMGHALALVFALGGHRVRLTDSNPATLAKAQGLMETALATLVQGGEAPADWTSGHLAQAVTRHESLEEAVDGAELIVEAIIEVPEAKRALYERLDACAPPDAILASNTSHLDVFPLIPKARQRRAMIAHWYTPPYLVDLVDMIPGPDCEPATFEQVFGMLKDMGKQPLGLKKFVPGYVANRIQAAIGLEVQHLLDEGVATAPEIDAAIIHGLALRLPILGFYAKADFTGLALMQAVMANRSYTAPEPRGSSPALDRLVAEGRTGVLAGAGYYGWPGDAAALFEARDRRLIALKQAMRQIGTMAGLERSE